ncbi:unnamed protein product [Rotaria sp. Silwood2]|nr:unnamed protein product [Rotaria sp. Silwood2]
MTTTTLLDKPLDDLCREITDLRQIKILRDYNMNKLCSIITVSRDSLKETEKFQQQILKQLQQFEISLADINDILRANSEQKIELEQQQQSGDDVDIRAKLMALNAEALECRAASVQLQLEARMVLSKATEIEKRANDELAQQALEMKIKQQEIERNRAEEYERRARLEEERQRLKELQQKQQEQERLLAMTKNHSHEDEYAHWSVREFMNDNQYPPCIIRTSSNASSMPINVKYLTVPETENLLDSQEELISTPINIKFDLTTNDQKFIILAIPFIFKRSSHRENVIKIRQSNGVWISTETNESNFDLHKEKRFVECKLNESSICAVVSRLKHDTILIQKQLSGRYVSNADPRFTLHWPKDVSQNDFSIDICVQPVDLPTFAQFSQHFSHECQGLLAVGPIIELNFDEINLLKPIQFTLPILIQPKKKPIPPKTIPTTNDESNILPQPTISQPSQQEMIAQQQQLIFKSMLGEDLSNERLVLLYSGSNDNTWHIDTDIQLIDSKTHDIITTDIQYLHSRIIVARCDKQLMSLKQLPTTICLLEQTLNQRSATLFLRRRLTNPNEICLVCCSGQRADIVENEIQQENYSTENEQVKEIILEEGQILELRFRGNIIPKNNDQQSVQFAFNTYFPFYFETNVSEIDKYSQHLSSYFYGFIQIFSKQKFLRNAMKEIDKKKQQSDIEIDICFAELLVTLPKPPTEIRPPIQKSLTTFTGEGVLTPTLFRDMSASLVGDEWRRLARRLGMTRIRIEAVERDYHEDAPYYMLLAWLKRVPRSSDKVLLLIHALTNINRWDLAQDLQSIKDDKRSEQGTFSKDEQLKLFRAPFIRICQRDECVRIWKQLARELMLTNEVIQHIEQQYPSKHERCLRSLEHWALNQTRADIPCLARIIRTLGFKPLAREIENMA